ncbi:cation diffusion facilitator family transporter [Salinicoccus bachuensis]|uniref:Cation diffusion facilitator family transporter n=1 Tax=Salinicoccus bachuensis TaxID=3136731 RepID=A0ABZ3CGQ8_9STAP
MNNKNAQKLIMISIGGALAFAALGIIWGLYADSQMIQFDGYYSFISVLLSMMSMMALRFISKEDPERFPFGKESFIPLTIVIKYFGILVLIIISLVQAFVTLSSGGNAMSMGSGVLYALISAVGCYVAYAYFKSKGHGDALITAEMNQWRMDALLSIGVLAGFIIGWVLSLTVLDVLVPFIDPVMVILVAGYFIKVPLSELYAALRELLEMAPDRPIAEAVEAQVVRIGKFHGFEDHALKLQKMGTKLYIEVDFIVPPENDLTILEQDRIRHELKSGLRGLTLDPWTTVVFTHERQQKSR